MFAVAMSRESRSKGPPSRSKTSFLSRVRPSKTKGEQKDEKRVLRSNTKEEEQRTKEEGQQRSREEPEGSGERKQGSREAEAEAGGRTRRKNKMEEEMLEKLLATKSLEKMKAGEIQEIWDFWRKERPNYTKFVKHTMPFLMASSGTFSGVYASGLIAVLWQKFLETEEAMKVPSRFANLSLSDTGRTEEHHLLSGGKYSFCSSTTAGSGPPLIFQDKGVEALGCVMYDLHYPAPPDDGTVEELFPKDDWFKVLLDADTKSESKLTLVFQKHRKKALELANCVFVKPKKELCDPKIPDFVLVDKECWEWPTADTVGALLFAQSTVESSKNYSSTYAVGEAVAVAQILLRSASQIRQFIFTGVTNFKKIRWFRVDRPGINGNFNGSRCCETASVRESLAGMMCCAKENLGICLQHSIVVGQEQYRVQRWLGEGATSYVYAVCVGNVECAAKVAKPGHSILTDLRNLEKLQDIKGIPKIVMSSAPSVLFITPVAKEFDLVQLCKNRMYQRVGELVETLECAHNRGIVNRDIRTANILIAEDQFIIVDWGFATSANEPGEYAGTIHFASSRVLKILEEEQYIFVSNPSDDLVSLVRSLYAFSRLDRMRVQSLLTDLGNDDFAEIQKFWETELCGSYWQEAEMYAEQCDYAQLKDWIQIRFERM